MIDHRLQVLRVVAAQGTVTGAARLLNYTPSAVSHQLRSLSADLGVAVVVPSGRGVQLTAAGRILLDNIDDLYRSWEEIRGELLATDPASIGTLALCGFSTAVAALLPTVAARVHGAHPRSTVRIIEADPDECFDLLLAGQADIAVVVAISSLPPKSDPRFEQHSLVEDPLDLLVPDDHALADQSSVLLSAAADEPWILDRPGRPLHQLVQSACAAAGFSPLVAHEVAEWDAGAALVDAGLGVSLIPRLARVPAGYRITRVPLRGDPTPARHLSTGVRRGTGRQPMMATALAALHEVAGGSHT